MGNKIRDDFYFHFNHKNISSSEMEEKGRFLPFSNHISLNKRQLTGSSAIFSLHYH